MEKKSCSAFACPALTYTTIIVYLSHLRGIPSDGRNIDHSIPKLDKRPPHHGHVQLGDVPQAELGQLLVLVLPQPADEALRIELLAILEGGETVFGKDVVELLGEIGRCDLELFAHLLEIAATHHTDDALGSEFGEQRVEFGRDALTCERERTVHVEEAERARIRPIAVA